MDSNIIKFRLSPDFLQMLESARNEDESLHQVAKRILENSLNNGTQLEDTIEVETVHTEQVNGTQLRQLQDTVESDFDPDVLKEQLKAELREELVSEINEVVKVNLEVAKDALLGE